MLSAPAASPAPEKAPAAPAPARPASERPYTLIVPGRRGSLDPRFLWRYRDLFTFLVWRDIQVRFGQTTLGIAWVVLQPLALVLASSVFFKGIAGGTAEGRPYALYTFAGVIAWQLFARIFGSAADSLVHEAKLITKVYFPRALLALAHAGSGLLEFAILLALTVPVLALYRSPPGWGLLALPLFLGIILATAGGVGLLVAALNVRYRDVRYVLPFVVQLWFFASPVVYGRSAFGGGAAAGDAGHASALHLLRALNPLVSAIDGVRWALLRTDPPEPLAVGVSVAVALLVFAAGTWYFQRLESTFADEL